MAVCAEHWRHRHTRYSTINAHVLFVMRSSKISLNLNKMKIEFLIAMYAS